MTIEEAILYLKHTTKDDFNLEEHQKQNRYEAIQVVLKEICALRQLVEWADECGSLDTIEDDELLSWEDVQEEMENLGWIDGLIYYTKRWLEENDKRTKDYE